MFVVDANVLLSAVNADSAHHLPARRWLDEALDGASAVGLSWLVLLAFVRISTNARILPTPLSLDEALDQVDGWLAGPAAVVLHPTPRHASVLGGLLRSVATGGNLVNDAHLAALAMEHHGTIVSFDRDFGRFGGLKVHVPA